MRQDALTRWTSENAAELYGIRGWGSGYFDVSPGGEVIVRPNGPHSPVEVSLMHLIYRHAAHESGSKDYEFSRLSMLDHWRAGLHDAERSLSDSRWTGRSVPEDGLFIFDLHAPDGEAAELD